MAQMVLGAAGALIAGYVTGWNPQAMAAGYAIGSGIGAATAPNAKVQGQQQPLMDLRVTSAEYGEAIPWVAGSVLIAGQIWWNTDRRPTTTETTTSSGGKGGGGVDTTSSTITYDMDLLIGLTDVPIIGIARIWKNGDLIFTADESAEPGSLTASYASEHWTRLTVYTGAADQLPDPTYEAAVGTENAPAYRGRGSVFIQGLKLGQGGQVPNLTFEVVTSGSTTDSGDTISYAPLTVPPWTQLGRPVAADAGIVEYHVGPPTTGTAYSDYAAAIAANAPGYVYVGFNTSLNSLPNTFSGGATVTTGVGVGIYRTPDPQYVTHLFGITGPTMADWTASQCDSMQHVGALPDNGVAYWTRWGGGLEIHRLNASGTPAPPGYGFDNNCTGYPPVGGGFPTSAASALIPIRVERLPSPPPAWRKCSAIPSGPDGIVEVVGDPTQCVTSDGTRSFNQTETYTVVSGTFKQLCPIQYRFGALYQNALGPIHVPTDPEYNDSAYWAAQRALAIAGEWMHSDVTSPVVVTSAARRTTTVYRPATVTKEPPSVAAVVSTLCQRAGLAAEQFDVTALSTITRPMRSLAVSRITSTRSTIELLAATYFFEMTTSDRIYFRPRGVAPVATIPYLDLGASKSTDKAEPFALKQTNDLEIPAQIALSYINLNDDYQTDTQYSDRLISATSGTLAPVQMAIGMSPAEAKAVADTMLLDQAASVITTNIKVLGDYCRLEPTDPVLVVAKDGAVFRLRLVTKTDSYPLLSFDAVIDDASVLSSQGITSTDYTSSTIVSPAVDTLMDLMDVPILQDTDNDAGFYVATKGAGIPYAGSVVFGSTDDVEYTRKATVLERAVLGLCTTTLGDYTGARAFDERNTVTVNVGAGDLASTTRDAVLNSLAVNLMLIGNELIQFRTATLVSGGVYILSGLLRGARGTEWAMTGHAADERCVLLRPAGLRRIAMANADLGLIRFYKGVTSGRAQSTAVAEPFTNNAVGLKPFSPINLRATRDDSNNVTFTWQRRTRLAVRMIGPLGISVPLGEDAERYELEIYDGGTYTTVKRTISTTAPTASYSAAEQTADGLTPGGAIYAKVFQISAQVGRGYPLKQAG